MIIDRIRARKAFDEYVKDYDFTDEKIKLKVDHTYKVADLCEEIAAENHLTDEDVDTAWLLGLLHDIGRFEQVRIYGTFIDALSVDHAQYSADLLFKDGLIEQFAGILKSGRDQKRLDLMDTAIRYHSAYLLPEDMDSTTRLFCNILRDADKIDILRVNATVPLWEIYNIEKEKFLNDEISDEVMQDFMKGYTVKRDLKRTAADYIAGHISLVFGLNYSISKKLVKEQGYLKEMFRFPTKNQKTKDQLKMIEDRTIVFLMKSDVQAVHF